MEATKCRKNPGRILRTALFCCAFASLSMAIAAQSNDFPMRAAEELTDLEEGTTLSQWMRAHPADTLVLYSHRYWDWGKWVVRATHRESLADSRELLRHAYFYVPPAPSDMNLPRGSNEQKLHSQTQLGLIWVETAEPSAEIGDSLAERMRKALSETFTPGQYDLKIWYANAAYWTKTARWTIRNATLVSAYEKTL